jgi:Flp pilus assembly pilin Flp
LLGLYFWLSRHLTFGRSRETNRVRMPRWLGAFRSREEGQTTAEYALVLLAAAAVAFVLIAWAESSGKLPAFFDSIIDAIMGDVQ